MIDFANNRDDDLWGRIRPDVKQITFFQPRNPPPASPLRGSRRCFGTSSNLLSEPLSTWRCLRTFAHLQQGLVATLWGKYDTCKRMHHCHLRLSTTFVLCVEMMTIVGLFCLESPSLLKRMSWIHQRSRQGQIWANIRMIKYFLLHLFLISQC